MNKCLFVGRVTKDLTLGSATSKGGEMPVVNFTLAVNDKNGANFAPMVAFGKCAELCCQMLRKGSLVEIESRFKSGSYQNKEKKTVYTYDFVVLDFHSYDSKNKGVESAPEPVGPTEPNDLDDYFDNMNMPF